jgi:hypothetical protein
MPWPGASGTTGPPCPRRAAKELAAAAAGGAFEGSRYTPGDSTHAVKHGRTGFTVSAHPDGRFHVWDTGLAHQGAHDTAAEAVAHAASPPPKPSPDYQPRTADVETAARQGAVADAAARRAGVAEPPPAPEPKPADRPYSYRHEQRAVAEKAWAKGTRTNDPNLRILSEKQVRNLLQAHESGGGESFTIGDVDRDVFDVAATKTVGLSKLSDGRYVAVRVAPSEPSPAAPGAGGGAGPKAGGFDPHAEAQRVKDMVREHVAAVRDYSQRDEAGRRNPGGETGAARAQRGVREVKAHFEQLAARNPSKADVLALARAYGTADLRGTKEQVLGRVRDAVLSNIGAMARAYASADHEPDPSEAYFRAERPVRFVPYVQPAGGARA